MAPAFLSLHFVAAILAAGLAAPAAAGDSRSVLVTATVRERTVVRVLSAPATLRLTPEDIARGMADGDGPVEVAVDTNAPEGLRLQLSLAAGPAQGVQPAEVAVPGEGSGRQRTTLNWRARFLLRPDAQPGVYAWPLQVQAASSPKAIGRVP